MPNPSRPFAGLEKVDFTGLRLRLVDAENQVREAAHCWQQLPLQQCVLQLLVIVSVYCVLPVNSADV